MIAVEIRAGRGTLGANCHSPPAQRRARTDGGAAAGETELFGFAMKGGAGWWRCSQRPAVSRRHARGHSVGEALQAPTGTA
jgi:hypothetical protein